jgi:type IX secretion system PorP/SprF family membrane protein
MKRYIPYLFVILASLTCGVRAQDMQFTQFYAAQTFLNPAFTGIHGCTRLSSNFRDQWPAIPGSFVSYTFSYDQYINSINSSMGILMTNDKAGTGKLRSTTVSFLYAYEVPISAEWRVRAGLQGGLATRNVNYHDLVFGDQIARGGATTSIHANNTEMALYPDLGTGALVYSERFWAGFSAHHLNRPNQSVMNGFAPVPIKYSIHCGAKIPVGEDEAGSEIARYVYPAFNYRSQQKFDQADVGFYYGHGVVLMGLWYRGIPLFKAYQKGYANNDAVAFLFGVSIDKMQIGYSYDLTISRLANSSAGAHEVSLNYIFCTPKKKKRRRLNVPCPKF